MHILAPTFLNARSKLMVAFQSAAPMHQKRWQGIEVSNDPSSRILDLHSVTLEVPLRGVESLKWYRNDIQPNLPWADDHFDERVCGYPLNPGKTWEYWPWNKSAASFLNRSGMFNHNYMERYWPRWPATYPTKQPNDFCDAPVDIDHQCLGLRGANYGDLDDVVDLLIRDPFTRQAYLPIFFPEDTGIGDGGRKPCTLGYHFYRVGNVMHVYYPMRSCDFAKHFQDDCYLTVRLLLWVLMRLRERGDGWQDVKPGMFTMHMVSCHLFINDFHMLNGDA